MPKAKSFKSDILSEYNIDDNGYLRAKGVKIARTGLLKYRTRNEYRSPTEVFDSKHLESIDGLPLTNNHPSKLLNPDTVKSHTVGSVSNPRKDGEFIVADVTIMEKNAIKEVLDGKVELSMGYTSEDVEKNGVFDGVEFDAIQTNLRGNHLAIVSRGRCGGDCKLDEDIKEPFENGVILTSSKNKKEDNMPSIKIDNVDYPVEDTGSATAIGNHISALNRKIDEMGDGMKDMKEKLKEKDEEKDGEKAKSDALQAKLDAVESSKLDADKLDALVSERIDTIDKARKLDDKMDYVGLSTIDIKKKAIGSKADGQTDAYVSGMFDALLDIKNDTSAGNMNTGGKLDGTDKNDAREDFQSKMLKRK